MRKTTWRAITNSLKPKIIRVLFYLKFWEAGSCGLRVAGYIEDKVAGKELREVAGKKMRVRFRIKLRDKSSCGKTVERNGWGKWNKLQEWRWGIGWIWKIVDFTLYPPYLPHTRLTETETVPVRTAARWWLFWSQKITGQGTYFFSTNNQGVCFFFRKKNHRPHTILQNESQGINTSKSSKKHWAQTFFSA